MGRVDVDRWLPLVLRETPRSLLLVGPTGCGKTTWVRALARRLSRADIIGEPGLLNVWATWCISCRVEHPYLQQLADAGIPIIGLNYKDSDAEALAWLAELGDPYRVNVADHQGTLGLDLGVYGAPETYLVDGQGVIRYRHVGVVDERVWRTILEPLYLELRAEHLL